MNFIADSVIDIKNLSKEYKNGHGIFSINLDIKKGETFAILGIEGAGKTTIIRHLLGFIKADSGNAIINGLDCWKDSEKIKKCLGYLSGDIAFLNYPNGEIFLKKQAEILHIEDLNLYKTLTAKLQLDVKANLKRMSKGMKQKTAIVAAFMNNPEILILDEPTTGLDPLMRMTFINILKEEKEKGKTVLMTSHNFNEVESICDRAAFIKDGRIIKVFNVKDIINSKIKTFKIEFNTKDEYQNFIKNNIKDCELREEQNQVIIKIDDKDINSFTNMIKNYNIKFFSETKNSLEAYFDSVYKENSDVK